MRIKVLFWSQFDLSGSGVVRAYSEAFFEQAESDLALMREYSQDKNWKLLEIILLN